MAWRRMERLRQEVAHRGSRRQQHQHWLGAPPAAPTPLLSEEEQEGSAARLDFAAQQSWAGPNRVYWPEAVWGGDGRIC